LHALALEHLVRADANDGTVVGICFGSIKGGQRPIISGRKNREPFLLWIGNAGFRLYQKGGQLPIFLPTGLRPGEKLFEEILTAEEGTDASRHEKMDESHARMKSLLRKYVKYYTHDTAMSAEQ